MCENKCLDCVDNLKDFKYRPWHKLFTSAIVHLTINCNLECRYCFVKQEPHDMTTQTFYDVIDFIAKNYEEKNELLGNILKQRKVKCGIIFFGGEPLLRYDDIIVKGYNYATEKYPDLFEFSVTTNGTLLTKEKIDFFYNNDIGILLSIDGDKETQDFNRPCKNGSSSFDKILENIPYLLEKFPETTFRSTISREKCNKVFENYLFAESLGFHKYFCVPDHLSSDWTEEEIKILDEQIMKIFEYRTNQFLSGIVPMYFSKINDTYDCILIHDINVIKNTFDQIPLQWDNCGLGLEHVGINWNGDIYGCQEQTYNYDENGENVFLIGNIYTGGIDKEKHLKLINEITSKNSICNVTPEKCNNCLAKNICHFNGCISCAYYTDPKNKNAIIMNNINCAWNEIMLKNCIVQMKILTDENCVLFEDYLLHCTKHFQEIKR